MGESREPSHTFWERRWRTNTPLVAFVSITVVILIWATCTDVNRRVWNDRAFPRPARVLRPARPAKASSKSELRSFSSMKPKSTSSMTHKRPCKRVLLIILFNQPHFYRNVDYLKRSYGNVFKNIVVYGPRPVPTGVHAAVAAAGDGGWYLQLMIIQAMKEHPGYDGYLWIGDDVWINYPQLLSKMDLNKIWLDKHNMSNFLDPKKFFNDGWGNWVKNFGLPAVRKHYAQIPPQFRRRSKGAFGADNKVICVNSDVGYIPRRFVKDFVSVASLMPDVIFEIAIPTAIYLTADLKDLQYFSDPLYLWYDGKRSHVWDFWSTERSFIHPVKVSDVKLRQLSSNWTKECEKKLGFSLAKIPLCR